MYNIKDDPATVKPTPDHINTFLDKLNLPTLSTEQVSTFNEPFSQTEICKVIDSLPCNKAPGPDGLPGEYYKQHKKILAPYFCNLFNDAASISSFPADMINALIITLPKPGKNPSKPHTFRPIALLNINLKVYVKIIAFRLMDILPGLVHRDQTGFVSGRQTSDATRRLINIIHFAERTRTPSLLLSLDTEKALNKIHWAYLRAVLLKVGFFDRILSAIILIPQPRSMFPKCFPNYFSSSTAPGRDVHYPP